MNRDEVETAASGGVQSRSPLRLWGKSLPDYMGELQAQAVREQLRREREEDRSRHGADHDRGHPTPGCTILVPDASIAEMQNVLVDNGLANFESQTALRITCKAVDAVPEIALPPLDSRNGIVHFPERSLAVLEVNIVDPIFTNRDAGTLPAFARAVLNGLNPAMTVRLVQKDIREYIARAYAPENVKWVGNLIASVAIAWSKRSAPTDVATLREFLSQGILHEYCHGLVLALPAGDIPVGWEAMVSHTLEKYINLVFGEEGKPLHSSVVMFKNVLKALRSLRSSPPSEETRDHFLRVTAIEMFCDRFGMYLYENALKNHIYRELLSVDGARADLTQTGDAEVARAEGRLQAFLTQRGVELSAEGHRQLQESLCAAERAHFSVAKFSDPPITDAERRFFANVLRLYKHQDREGALTTLSAKHVRWSTAIQMGPWLSAAHIGVADVE